MVGRALATALLADGHDVVPLVRDNADGIHWTPATGEFDQEKMGDVDVLVHLAGENIAQGRWTKAKKERIRSSRTDATRLLCESLAKMKSGPRTMISASAIGIYGDRGDEVLDEDAAPGEGFLPDVCRNWESATQVVVDAGMRVVNLRLGMVLSRAGGALKPMLLPFKLGLGGRMGSGRQYWSWITLTDAVRVIQFTIDTPTLSGPVNAVTPVAVTNLEFTKALGKAIRRPTIFPMPGPAARMVLGQMADGLILASARVVPRKLEEAGFKFSHSQLDDALQHVLANKP
jgi:uncharacterized protein (TIGR01777 family)